MELFCKIYNYISEVDVMIDQETLNKFDKLYNESYKNILKYVICNCSNVEDVEDIVQNVYVDLLKKINKINIDKLEELLVADEKWQQQIMLQLADSHADLNDKEKLRRLLHRFFNYLRICHVDMKEESDCRAHFFNKLTKEYLKAPAETKPKYDPRRPVEIFPDSPQDYYSSF